MCVIGLDEAVIRGDTNVDTPIRHDPAAWVKRSLRAPPSFRFDWSSTDVPERPYVTVFVNPRGASKSRTPRLALYILYCPCA
jgi:hypothetical protein